MVSNKSKLRITKQSPTGVCVIAGEVNLPLTRKERLKRKLRLKQRRSLRKQFKKKDPRKTNEWLELRYIVLARDRRCCLCGSKDQLHVDHIKPVCTHPELAFDPNNLQVLCKACNLGKGYKFTHDFRDENERMSQLLYDLFL